MSLVCLLSSAEESLLMNARMSFTIKALSRQILRFLLHVVSLFTSALGIALPDF